MKALIRLTLICAIVTGSMSLSHAQTTRQEKKAAKIAAIKKMVEEGNYVFWANYALPLSGGQKALTPDYDLSVSKDSIIAFLPYFGVAHLAPDPGTTDGGIKFTSTNFDYTTTPRKNGTWDVYIKPKDNNIANWRDVQQMRLNISQSGYASLEVISSNRDPISFNGEIAQKTKM